MLTVTVEGCKAARLRPHWMASANAMLFRFAFAFAASATFLPSAMADEAKPRQAVLISFDGAKDISQWHRSLALGDKTGARFTYFLSCVYLLSPENKAEYQPPAVAPSHSNVGFGDSRQDVSQRLNLLYQAFLEGHEIASHGCGHFDGAKWSAREWAQEFAAFNDILARAWVLNGDKEPAGWRDTARHFSTGFRAPYLSTGPGLAAAEKTGGFLYDASGITRGILAPETVGGMVRFSLPTLPEGPQNRRIISMDYNLFVRHSGGFERHDTGSIFEQRTYDMLKAAFEEQYNGKRQPLQFGLHFTLMNGGAYWRAAERFVTEVCAKPDVDCTTYEAYARQLRKGSKTGRNGAS